MNFPSSLSRASLLHPAERRPDFAALPGRDFPGAEPVPLADEFATRDAGAVTLLTRCYASAAGELRSVHLRSPRAEIFNQFFFPHAGNALPVYVLEAVIFGDRPVVGVLDLAVLNDSGACARFAEAALDEAHAAFPGLQPADDAPAWYQECRSQRDFFVRPASLAALGELMDCHERIWTRLAGELSAGASLDPRSTRAHATALRHYKDHHRAHSPGRPFLQKTFGEGWTNRFLADVLFV